MSESDGSDDPGQESGLSGAQAAIRDACFAHDAGLFVLACGPGSGKSYTADRVSAEALARAATSAGDGAGHPDPAPEETICLTSFSRDDAASILPGVEDALTELAADPEAPVDLAPETATSLARRLRASDRVGTVDSVLLSVFERLAEEVGFEGIPAVGDSAGLALTRGDAMTAVRDDPSLAAPIRRLDDAYPQRRYKRGVAGLLADAQRACRERRLSVEQFRDRIETVVAAAYPDGTPSSAADVLRDVERFVGREERDAVASALGDGGPAVVSADATLHVEWKRTIAAFCEVLAAYVDAYDEACRANGVVSHVDVAHWVAAFFEREVFAGEFRGRLQARYTDRLSTVVVDEAQDLSRVQHDALAPLVDDATRVFLVGDLQQCIYAWRNAQPSLFARAYHEGTYFGVDWATHETASERRTHRCRPGVAAGLDAVFGPVFDDGARGAAGSLVTGYEPLDAVRAGVEGANVHVAAFEGVGRPGSKRWVSPRGPGTVGEADALADCIAAGLADGRFASAEKPDPGVTVLFQRRTFMAAHRAAFEARGLSVADASRSLFDHPLVELVVAVCAWLDAPGDSRRTMDLVNEDSVPLDRIVHHLVGEDVHSLAGSGLPSPEAEFVAGLSSLARRLPDYLAGGAAGLVSAVVDELSLETDPFDQCDAATDPVTVLDRLVSVVESWEGDDRYTLAQTVAALQHATDGDGTGPTLPTTGDPDVTFRTIHDAKGDEDDVVAVADLGEHVQRIGASLDRFVAHGPHLALAPPANVDRPENYPDLEGTVLGDGPYDPTAKPGEFEAGLRWASERWVGTTTLAGPTPLAAAGGDARGERWRLLFVACSRARDHLVLPLPASRDHPEPRDRWCDAIREGLAFDATRSGTYQPPVPEGSDPFEVRVHLVGDDPAPANTAAVGGTASDDPSVPPLPSRVGRPGWTPRFCNPSTLHPLSTAPGEYVLDHLQNRPLHADHDGLAADLPLGFETMGPDVVGTVAHHVVATALSRDIDTETLRDCGGPLTRALDDALSREAGGVSRAEREMLRTYVADTLCPQLADSALWERLASSEVVYVEESLDTVRRSGNLPVELGGQADVVSVDGEGRWRVDDVKVTLYPLDADVRARYELQTAAYAWVLGRQLDSRGRDSGASDVVPAVTTLGVETGTHSVDCGDDAVTDALDSMVGLTGLGGGGSSDHP